MRGLIQGKQEYGAVAFGMKAVLSTPVPMSSNYRALLVEIVKFFQTGVPPVDPTRRWRSSRSWKPPR